jgi:hypothetical protein
MVRRRTRIPPLFGSAILILTPSSAVFFQIIYHRLDGISIIQGGRPYQYKAHILRSKRDMREQGSLIVRPWCKGYIGGQSSSLQSQFL